MTETEIYTVEYRDLAVPERVLFETDDVNAAWRMVQRTDNSPDTLKLIEFSPNMLLGI